MMGTDKGNWSQHYGGIVIHVQEPETESIDFRAIAHSLALQCRYAGHCRYFYPVALHSVIMAYAVHPRFSQWALVHDAAEGILPDMPKPIKDGFEDYTALEDGWLRLIVAKLGLEWPMPEVVDRMDKRLILAAEKTHLMPENPRSWGLKPDDFLPELLELVQRIGEIPWRVSEVLFITEMLNRFEPDVIPELQNVPLGMTTYERHMFSVTRDLLADYHQRFVAEM